MMRRRIDRKLLANELEFSASRSSGPGGQNVNKVNSKVTLKFNIQQSLVLTDQEKEIISSKLLSRLTKEGDLLLSSQDKRSQLDNKDAVIGKFEKLLAKVFEKRKIRRATKPSKSSVQNRIKEKKRNSEKKAWRSGKSDR